ncbi:MAG: NRDE family protein [Deltaproteobacteria bacterium]|nr:NRDE family protein [Deltaproteobacteria bacterium]
MCFIVFAYQVHPAYRLIAVANRDEFYERPTSPVAFWEDAPQVLAGRDLKEGGTWMGITRGGKFTAITNYRDPGAVKTGALSRGLLVSDFLTGSESAAAYVEKLSRQARKYNGFNLLCGDQQDLFVYSNRGEMARLEAGLYGLSNHLLDSPWPKVIKGKKALSAALMKKGPDLETALFKILSDRKIAPDNKLPSTGVGLEWERLLSSIFIASPTYGTRSSTVLLIGKNRRVKLVEKVFNGRPEPWMESRFSFLLKGVNE